MQKSKVFVIIIFLILSSMCYNSMAKIAYAVDGKSIEYTIYDESGTEVSRKSYIEEGDSFITSDFYEYEVYKVEGFNAYARVIKEVVVPQINRQNFPQKRSFNQKKIGLYMTHNDESYTPTDGYDSIYGKGGIHDVANGICDEFSSRGIDVTLDETLHIPHDSGAYSRSSVTAKRLNNEAPDALFDIHRDGISKKYYYTSHNGKDFSKIRIVVGKSNPNFEENYLFAQKVFALGASMYPWLFLDIYCGKGHYNQSLKETNLLFEMGTYMIEKDYVYNSIPYLADVIETALYNSVSNGEDEIIVDDQKTPETNEIITEGNNEISARGFNSNRVLLIVASVFVAGSLAWGTIALFKKLKNKKPLI